LVIYVYVSQLVWGLFGFGSSNRWFEGGKEALAGGVGRPRPRLAALMPWPPPQLQPQKGRQLARAQFNELRLFSN